MADASFNDVFDWFVDRKAQRAYIEIGQADPQTDLQADAPVVRLHATLGRIHDVENMTHSRRLAWVRFEPEDGRDGLHLDEARFVRAAVHPSGVLKVWLHDIA